MGDNIPQSPIHAYIDHDRPQSYRCAIPFDISYPHGRKEPVFYSRGVRMSPVSLAGDDGAFGGTDDFKKFFLV